MKQLIMSLISFCFAIALLSSDIIAEADEEKENTVDIGEGIIDTYGEEWTIDRIRSSLIEYCGNDVSVLENFFILFDIGNIKASNSQSVAEVVSEKGYVFPNLIDSAFDALIEYNKTACLSSNTSLTGETGELCYSDTSKFIRLDDIIDEDDQRRMAGKLIDKIFELYTITQIDQRNNQTKTLLTSIKNGEYSSLKSEYFSVILYTYLKAYYDDYCMAENDGMAFDNEVNELFFTVVYTDNNPLNISKSDEIGSDMASRALLEAFIEVYSCLK